MKKKEQTKALKKSLDEILKEYEKDASSYVFFLNGIVCENIENIKNITQEELGTVGILPHQAAKAIFGTLAKENTVTVSTKDK